MSYRPHRNEMEYTKRSHYMRSHGISDDTLLDDMNKTILQAEYNKTPHEIISLGEFTGFKKEEKIPCGFQRTVPVKHLDFAERVRANILLNGISRDLDIFGVLYECRHILINDTFANPDYVETERALPKTEHALIFLSVLAEKMGCDVSEFFVMNDEWNTNQIINLIRDVDERDWDNNFRQETGGTTIWSTVDWDEVLLARTGNDSVNYKDYFDSNCSPTLTITKEIFPDNSAWYRVYLGDYNFSGKSQYDYMITGAYLWEGESGPIAECIESHFKENADRFEGDTISGACLYSLGELLEEYLPENKKTNPVNNREPKDIDLDGLHPDFNENFDDYGCQDSSLDELDVEFANSSLEELIGLDSSFEQSLEEITGESSVLDESLDDYTEE